MWNTHNACLLCIHYMPWYSYTKINSLAHKLHKIKIAVPVKKHLCSVDIGQEFLPLRLVWWALMFSSSRVKIIVYNRQETDHTSLHLSVLASCSAIASCRASVVNAWWLVDLLCVFQNGFLPSGFSLFLTSSLICGCRCLFGELGVDVKTNCFKAFSSACKTSVCNNCD